MNVRSVVRKLRLVKQWDKTCTICGEPFANLACVTYDHIRPVSLGGTGELSNFSPVHEVCNKLRGNRSLLRAVKIVNQKLDKKRTQLTAQAFTEWLNAPVGDREVPWYAKLPIEVPLRWFETLL